MHCLNTRIQAVKNLSEWFWLKYPAGRKCGNSRKLQSIKPSPDFVRFLFSSPSDPDMYITRPTFLFRHSLSLNSSQISFPFDFRNFSNESRNMKYIRKILLLYWILLLKFLEFYDQKLRDIYLFRQFNFINLKVHRLFFFFFFFKENTIISILQFLILFIVSTRRRHESETNFLELWSSSKPT